tara:strand:+ start:240 stop:491 length:252 start_codon:yes stop_codon:yes gene_type:complete
MSEKEIGEITHYFSNVGVAVLKLTESLKVGDKIHIKGLSVDFEQEVKSMQIERKPIEEAKAGDDVGMKVDEPVKGNEKVYLIK